jgi:hypothetical protein
MFRHERRKEDEERKIGARQASGLIWCPRPFKSCRGGYCNELDFPNLREILGGKEVGGKKKPRLEYGVLYCNR